MCTGDRVLPEILDDKQHRLTVSQARNPLLIKTMPDYVPNDIHLDLAGRVLIITCLLYTSDAADERSSVDLGGRRIIKKKTNKIQEILTSLRFKVSIYI